MRYELKQDWKSKRHGKTFKKGLFLIITKESDKKELIELGCIDKPKEVKKKKKN